MPISSDSFHSPTHGDIKEGDLIDHIRSFVTGDPERTYRLIVGTDSLPNIDGEVYLVTAVVLHRVGAGGIYFWQRTLASRMHTLRDRMYAEALSSIGMAQRLERRSELKDLQPNIEIHVDVGPYGPTKEMIQELTGMIVAHGYAAKTKPESFAASKVADRHTIPGPRLELAPVYIQS